MKLGLLTAAFPSHARGGRGLGGAHGFGRSRSPAGRRAAARNGATRACRTSTPRPRRRRRGRRPRVARRHAAWDLLARLLPQPPPPRPKHRAEVNAHLDNVVDAAVLLGVGHGRHVRRRAIRAASRPRTCARSPRSGPRSSIARRRRASRSRSRTARCCSRATNGRAARTWRYSPRIWREMFDVIPDAELRPQSRPVAPRLADDRLRASGLRLRGSHLPRPRQGHGDRPRRPLPARRTVGRHRLADAAAAWTRRGALGSLHAALYAIGYDRWIRIEHEDRAFEGDEELVKRGFLIARDVLRPYVH